MQPQSFSSSSHKRLKLERMSGTSLTEEERQQALALKAAIESSDHIKSISDFDCVTVALACNGDLERALSVAFKLQCFREHYKIEEAVEDAIPTIRGFMHQQPGLILEVCYLPTEQTYWFFLDFAKFLPALVKSDQDFRFFQGGAYYIYRAMSSNIQGIRNGAITMIECEGASMQNVNFKFEERIFHELWAYNPVRYKETFCLHASMAFILLLGVLKRLMNNSQLASLKTTCSLGGYEGRVDALFKLPTLEIAQENLLARIEGYLVERYRNEREFSLT
jgi:hypothetical protein